MGAADGLLLCTIISVIYPGFYRCVISRLLTASAAPLMIAIGVTFIIIMGLIDLSIEGIMAFCGSMLAIIMVKLGGFSELGYLAIPAAFLFLAACGLINGLIHVKLKIPHWSVWGLVSA